MTGSPEEGIGAEDLPEVMHDLFMQCVADARVAVNPHDHFDGFVEQLWRHVSEAFSLVPREWPEDLPQPWPAMVEAQRGVAEAALEGRLKPGELPS